MKKVLCPWVPALVLAAAASACSSSNSEGGGWTPQTPPRTWVALPQTGQLDCVDPSSGTPTSCEGTGQDGELRAGVNWQLIERFTDNGATVTDNLTGLVWLRDANCMGNDSNAKAFDKDGTSGDGRVLWQHSLDFVAELNKGAYPGCSAGKNDWRLPNAREMRSLIDYGESKPSFLPPGSSPPYFQSVGSMYWTSSNLGWAAVIAFGEDGRQGWAPEDPADAYGPAYYYVWPVRDGYPASAALADLPQTGQSVCRDDIRGRVIACSGTGQDGEKQAGVALPDPRFTDNGDGTMKDNLTGLVWLKDANCVKTQYVTCDATGCSSSAGAGDHGETLWPQALAFVRGVNEGTYSSCRDKGNHTDWRLPNVNELESLLDYGYPEHTCGSSACSSPREWLMSQGFENVGVDGVQSPGYYVYWTSTGAAFDPAHQAWAVDFGHLNVWVECWAAGTNCAQLAYLWVWPVRGGW